MLFPSLPDGLKYSARFFTASLLYHLDKILKYIPSSHSLLLASFLTSSEIQEIILKIQINCAWDEDVEVEVYKNQDGLQQVEEASGELSGSTGDKSSEFSLESEKTMPRRTQRIWKATGIPAHVMLMADMQRVIRYQQSVIVQVVCIIKKEFDQREVGHAIFQVQHQVEKMLSSFKSRVATKLDSLK